jgi:PTH1 family peptidyl-tRNA hydrolase
VARAQRPGARSDGGPLVRGRCGVKLVVGLGNPGSRYAGTRHNIGFELIDAFAARHGIEISQQMFLGHFGCGSFGSVGVGLLKPQTFMNASGSAVEAAISALSDTEYSPDLILVFDDLDLPFGRVRLRAKGGAGGHRGIADVIDALGGRDFARLRFGVGRPSARMSTVEHVLQAFSSDEKKLLPEKADLALRALESLIVDGVESAMNRFNSDSGDES